MVLEYLLAAPRLTDNLWEQVTMAQDMVALAEGRAVNVFTVNLPLYEAAWNEEIPIDAG